MFKFREKLSNLSCRDMKPIGGLCSLTLMMGTIVSLAPAQQASLSLASGTATPGGSVTLNLALTNSGGSAPSGIEWAMSYPATDISGVTVNAGAAATAASKTLSCNGTSASTVCVISGLNTTAIGSGTVASVTFKIATSPADAAVPVQLAGLSAAAGDGSSVAATGTGGSISVSTPISVALSGLSCSPTNVATPGSATCTVSLNTNAAGSGFPVAVNSNNSNVTVPSSVTVPASQSAVGFTAKAASVSTAQSAVITTTASATSRTATLSLSPTGPAPVLISSLACSPTSLYSAGSSSCTLALTSAAASSVSMKVGSNNSLLTVPSSVSIAAGASSVKFTAKAGTIAGTQSAVITATGPNNSQSFTESLLAASTPVGPVSLWSPTAVPGTITDPDTNAVEVGVNFYSDVAGTVTGVRFYKGPKNTGTHVGHLWTTTGTLLGTVTFTNETWSGWQQANFAKPIPIQAHTVYVVSYYSPASHYSSDDWYFHNSGVNNGPLHAPQDGTLAANGVYSYGGGFPNQSWESSNYWVDVVFTPAQ